MISSDSTELAESPGMECLEDYVEKWDPSRRVRYGGIIPRVATRLSVRPLAKWQVWGNSIDLVPDGTRGTYPEGIKGLSPGFQPRVSIK